jgi:DNA-binding CsgD family transcriptional regulator
MKRDQRVFISLLDWLPLPLVAYDEQAHRIHANDACEKLLKEGGRRSGERALDDFAQACLTQKPTPTLPNERTQVLQHGLTRMLLRACIVPLPLFETDGCMLVSVSETRGALWKVNDVQAAFRLTRQQARIALGLAAGLSNREIAQQLSISPHTARRHTEQVMLKLSVQSRAQVAALLARTSIQSSLNRS